MTVVVFLHPRLVSVRHHLSETNWLMSDSIGCAINDLKHDLSRAFGTSTLEYISMCSSSCLSMRASQSWGSDSSTKRVVRENRHELLIFALITGLTFLEAIRQQLAGKTGHILDTRLNMASADIASQFHSQSLPGGESNQNMSLLLFVFLLFAVIIFA